MHADILQKPLQARIRVTGQAVLGAGLHELWLESAALARALPGQFVHVRCGESYLRRPFSVYRVEGGRASVLYHVRGAGTRWMATLVAGDSIDALGPLGRAFAPPQPGERLLLVGGGVGLAPLARFAEHYGAVAGMGAIAGFRSAAHIAGLSPFEQARVPFTLFTEDGSAGTLGRVTTGLRETLREQRITRVLTCGPDAMMRAVASIAAETGATCHASLERPMGCGIGLCLGCVVPVQGPDGMLRYERACVEGPVFDAREVQW